MTPPIFLRLALILALSAPAEERTAGAEPASHASPDPAGPAGPRKRTRVPRVVRNVAPTAIPTPAEAEPPVEAAAQAPAKGPIDRRENPPADSPPSTGCWTPAVSASAERRLETCDSSISHSLA